MDRKTDILIVGTGLAGALSALTAAEKGKQVIMITKTKEILSGNTPYAQGGIIYKGNNDSIDKLKNDIIDAGDELCWEPAVDQLAKEGPELVKNLLIDKYLVDFDKDKTNGWDFTAEGAHSEPRIIHSKDQTGTTIQTKIIKELEKNENIEILKEHTLVDLLTLSHHSKCLQDIYKKPACFGVFVLNNNTQEVFPIIANETILATGGLGQIYKHTSNPPESTGDGIGIAWRAGVRCFNLQYIQFHPTTLYHDRDRFLISESMRGEGGKLVDKFGNEFMQKYHELGSLAPRDIVARGIHQTMLETEHPCVYLDIRTAMKSSDWIKNRFPNIYKHCRNAGIDITKELIPVVPSAHYSCGGIGVNLNGRTSFQRLYAIGEVSCTGVHGANRLASTSLLESVVWGYKAGLDAVEHSSKDDYFPDIYSWQNENESVDPALIAQDWTTVKNTMWNYVGLIRTRQRLLRASTTLRHLQSEIEQFYQKAKLTRELLQLRNGVQTAIAVTMATLEARESKGSHFIANKD